jgi:hypothetical protein
VIIEMPRNLPRSFKEVRDMKLKLVVLVTIVFLGTMILSYRTSSVTGLQSADTFYPKERATLSEYVQEAKKQGKSKVVIGAPVGYLRDVKGLSDALSVLSLLNVEPVAQISYAAGSDYVITWIKFRIIEDLSQRDFGTASSEHHVPEDLPQVIADALLPVGDDEILVSQAGGILSIDGVTLISETPDFPLLSMDQRYLLFVEKSHTGKTGITTLGGYGVFKISESGLIKRLVPKPHPVGRDINRNFGDSLSKLKEGLGKRSFQNQLR